MYSDQNYNRSCGNQHQNNYQNSNQNYNGRNYYQASGQHGLNEDVVTPKPHHPEELQLVLFTKKYELTLFFLNTLILNLKIMFWNFCSETVTLQAKKK